MPQQRLAFLFPGQGQIPQALPPLSADGEALCARAEAAGIDLRAWLRAGERARLARTDAAQPLVYIDSLARLAVLRSRGLAPDAVAGHSLGEYAALVAAGALDAATGLDLVLARGRLMASVPGGMVAVLKLDRATVDRLCETVGRGAVVANVNGSQQFVVSAPPDALGDVERTASDLGGRAIRLEVSGPFHSPAMRPAEAALAPAIRSARFASPRLEFVSSAAAKPQREPEEIRAGLARQMTAPVRWTETLAALSALGVTEAVELGEGSVLTQLGRRAEPKISFRTYAEVCDA